MNVSVCEFCEYMNSGYVEKCASGEEHRNPCDWQLYYKHHLRGRDDSESQTITSLQKCMRTSLY